MRVGSEPGATTKVKLQPAQAPVEYQVDSRIEILSGHATEMRNVVKPMGAIPAGEIRRDARGRFEGLKARAG